MLLQVFDERSTVDMAANSILYYLWVSWKSINWEWNIWKFKMIEKSAEDKFDFKKTFEIHHVVSF